MGYKIQKIYIWVNNTRGLPSTYQEVEYIQSSGTQYIDTGIAIKDGFKIICNTEFVSWGTYMALGGYLGQSGGTYYRLYGGASNAGKWVYGFLGYYSNDLGNSLLNTKYELELQIKSGDNYFKVNGTTMASGTQTFSTSLTGNIGVLAGYADDASGKWNKWSAKMYDYKIRDNGGTLIRDFVPCYRKSDNVIGMYDLVNNQFYTNSGTGTFTKGANIPDMVEKQVRPSSNIFEFDFTDSTGWSLTNTTIANGKIIPTQGSGYGYYDTGIDIKDANKITIDATVYGTTGSWVGLIYLTFYEAAGQPPSDTTTPQTGMIINYMTNNGYNKSGVKIAQDHNYTHDMYTVTTSKYGNGVEMPVHCEIDILNKTVSFSMDNTLIGTQTISDADINTFKSTSRTKFGISISRDTWYVSYLKIEIE